MSIFVKKPGLSTTVQDLGRTGHLSSGFSPNGAMDRHAASVANILVGNARNASLLEFVMTGPTLRFAKQTFIALAGADFNAELNGSPVPLNQAVPVPAGSLLTCNAATNGMFGYLAFAGGGLNVPLVMGSASTNLKCGIGGWNGRALAYGDCLPLCRDASFLPNLPARKANEAIASEEGDPSDPRGSRPPGRAFHRSGHRSILRGNVPHHLEVGPHGVPPGRPRHRDEERLGHRLRRHRFRCRAGSGPRAPHRHAGR